MYLKQHNPAGWFILMLSLGTLSACTAPSPTITATSPANDTSAPTSDNGWWQPEPGLRWQIQYTGELELDFEADLFFLDLFETPVAEVERLQARGARVVCYLNAGSWEDWRPDSDDFPADLLGLDYTGWPGERWLDIRQMDQLAPLMSARLDLCAAKGFDGVEPDNLDGVTNATGFTLTAADQLTYNRWLAQAAHQRGLGIGLKNDPDQAADLVDAFDWAVTESCFFEGWCERLSPFTAAGKPVFAIEYTDQDSTLADFCAPAADLSINAILKHRDLDAWQAACP